MPRLKEKPKPFSGVSSLLYGEARERGVRGADMAKMLDCSTGTVSNRFNNPEQWQLGELKILSQRLRIPFERVIQAIGAAR